MNLKDPVSSDSNYAI